ncbi:MAG: 23S rRNA (pseudouridine(1915)-N(3))-methyltransferase RlmH, partial [Pacificimonas sp.]
MRLHIIARGRIGRGAEADLVGRYAKRCRPTLLVSELPETGGKVPEPLTPHVDILVDERGRDLSSAALAER